MPRVTRRRFIGGMSFGVGLLSFPAISLRSGKALSAELGQARDERDAKIISDIAEYIRTNQISGISAIGPVSDDGSRVQLFWENSIDKKLRSSIEIRINGGQANIELVPVKDPGKTKKFNGTSLSPPQHSGPMMGGDPVWNNDASEAGTITFFCDPSKSTVIDGQSCTGQGISARHVWYDDANSWGDLISTTNYPDSMTRAWKTVPSFAIWHDLAGANLNASAEVTPVTVRGLGKIKGVRQPAYGDRVSKYSWQTGLTSGVDLGLVGIPLDASKPLVYFILRRVSGRFAQEGDSGSAVVDKDRNLVGIVVAGKDAANETYYIQAVPHGETPVPFLSAFEVQNL